MKDSGLRHNAITALINMGKGPESIKPPLTPKELKDFREAEKQLAELRETNPGLCFWPIESDW